MEPVVALFWLMVGVIAVTSIFFRYLRERSRNALFQTQLEKGQAIPPNLFYETSVPWDHRGFTVVGILLIALGLATALFGWSISPGLLHRVETEKDNLVLFVSLFPLILGGASMVAGRYLRSHG